MMRGQRGRRPPQQIRLISRCHEGSGVGSGVGSQQTRKLKELFRQQAGFLAHEQDSQTELLRGSALCSRARRRPEAPLNHLSSRGARETQSLQRDRLKVSMEGWESCRGRADPSRCLTPKPDAHPDQRSSAAEGLTLQYRLLSSLPPSSSPVCAG